MEITQSGIQEHSDMPDITFTRNAQLHLQQAGKWASFLGIAGFVFCAIILFFVLMEPAGAFTGSNISVGALPIIAVILIKGVYILLNLVYFFFSLYLYQFGTGVKKGIAAVNSIGIEEALGKLKSYFKLFGMFIITGLALCILMLVIPLIVSTIMPH